jgi:hypothetical protein
MQSMRGASFNKIFRESVKQSIMSRFSLIGMAATLTRSNFLRQAAIVRYANKIEDEKMRRSELAKQEQEERWRSYLVGSIKTLTNQTNLLTAATQKNTALINMILGDLGYFKGQRKFNVLSQGGTFKSVKMPMQSKSVKGRIEAINKEIQLLKELNYKMPTSPFEVDERITKEKVRREKENEKLKTYINSAVAAAIGAAGLTALGAGIAKGNVSMITGGALTTATGLLSSEIARQGAKRLIGTAVPLIGKVFKVSLLYQAGMSVAERTSKRLKGGSGFELKDEDSYKNKEEIGTQEYYARQQEIELKKSINYLIETPLKEVDQVLIGMMSYMSVVGAGKFIKWAGSNKFLRKYLPFLPGKAPIPLGTDKAALAAAGIVPSATQVPASEVMSSSIKGGGNMLKAVAGGGAAVAAAAAARPLGAAPAPSGTKKTFTRSAKRTLPRNLIKSLVKLQYWVKNNKFMGYVRTAGVGIGLLLPTVLDMIQAAEQYEKGVIGGKEYKDTMVGGIKTFVETVGVTGLSAAVGGLFGGPAGFFAGLGGGAIATLFLDENTTAVSEQIFDFISGTLKLIPEPLDVTSEVNPLETKYNLTSAQISTISKRTTDSKKAQSVMSEDVQFANEVMRVSAKYSIDPADLLSVMLYETGGTLDPSKKNPNSSATGLIQFMDSTAKSLGTTTAQLAKMSRVEQMKYVEKYFDMNKLPQGADLSTIYAYVFMPGRASRGEVLAVEGEDYYKLNSQLDVDKDGNITIPELGLVLTGKVKAMPALNANLQKTVDMDRSYIEKAVQMITAIPRESSVEKLDMNAETTSMLPENDSTEAKMLATAALLSVNTLQKQNQIMGRNIVQMQQNLNDNTSKPLAYDPTLPDSILESQTVFR